MYGDNIKRAKLSSFFCSHFLDSVLWRWKFSEKLCGTSTAFFAWWPLYVNISRVSCQTVSAETSAVTHNTNDWNWRPKFAPVLCSSKLTDWFVISRKTHMWLCIPNYIVSLYCLNCKTHRLPKMSPDKKLGVMPGTTTQRILGDSRLPQDSSNTRPKIQHSLDGRPKLRNAFSKAKPKPTPSV